MVTGSEDGALATMGSIMMVLTWMGFTLPPECAAYWVGEVGQPVAQDRPKRLANEATKHMAKNLARNLAFYAQLLKDRPSSRKPADVGPAERPGGCHEPGLVDLNHLPSVADR